MSEKKKESILANEFVKTVLVLILHVVVLVIINLNFENKGGGHVAPSVVEVHHDVLEENSIDNADVRSVVVSKATGIDRRVEPDISDDSSRENEQDQNDSPTEILPNDLQSGNESALKVTVKKLSVVHNLIAKFFQNGDYRVELQEIYKSDLPKDVSKILEDMQIYADKFLSIDETEDIVFPKAGFMDRVVGKFVKVQRSKKSTKEKRALHKKISDDIHILEDYFYSTDHSGKVVNHD